MMNPDSIAMYAWIVWVALILIFVIIEVFTLDFTFLMIAVGSIGGVVSSLAGAEWWAQVLISGVLAIVLIFLVRPPLLKLLRKGADPTLSNVERLLGSSGEVTTGFGDGIGYVKLSNGETWTSRIAAGSSRTLLEPGDRVIVVAIDGATAMVAPVEGTSL